jgi:hypothetical protein
MRFLVPPGGASLECAIWVDGTWSVEGRPAVYPCIGRGHRPCHSALLTPRLPGAKAPGQRPPRPRRALRPRRVGRWPALRVDLPVYGEPSRTGGETQCVSCSRPHQRKHFHRFNDGGHRPCHSASLTPRLPGAKAHGQRPPRPPGGRWPPVVLGETVPRRSGLSPGGERRCVSGCVQPVNPAPEAGRLSRPAGGQDAFPALC